MAHSNPSICIPRMFPNQTKQMVFSVFRQLNLGEIDRIDLVKRKQQDGSETMRGFIHFKKWYDNESAAAVMTKFRSENEKDQSFKVQYHDRWYWICTKSRISKPKHEGARPEGNRQAPRLVLDMGNDGAAAAADPAPSTPPASPQKEPTVSPTGGD